MRHYQYTDCKGKDYDNYWQRVKTISFILAVFIVIRHNSSFSNYSGELASIFIGFYEGFKHSITEIAVPMFFIVSGFNFFRNYSLEKTTKKLKGRIKSLLIPYIFWNCVYTVFNIVTSYTFLSNYFIGRERFVATPFSILGGCLYHWTCNTHFWFVFNLMLFVLINPLTFMIIRRKSFGIVFLLILIGLVSVMNYSLPIEFIYRTDSILYYYLGAFIAVHYKGKVLLSRYENTHRLLGLILGIVFVMMTLLLLLPEKNEFYGLIIRLIGCYGIWLLSSSITYYTSPKLPQGGTIFLLYAVHGIIQPIVVKLLYLALPKWQWMGIVNFVLAVTITIFFCILTRYISKRYIPILDKIMTGWRR